MTTQTMMQTGNVKQMAFVGLAALGGVALAMLAGKRFGSHAETYRTQSGDRARQSESDIQERDRKIFRAEVQRRW